MKTTLENLTKLAENGTFRVMVKLTDDKAGPLKNGWTGSPLYQTGVQLRESVVFAQSKAMCGQAKEIRLVPMDGETFCWTA